MRSAHSCRLAVVSTLHWGAHDATNDYANVPNIILAGTLFLRPSYYEALGRLSHPPAGASTKRRWVK
jgi:hypothetical protein